MKEEIAQVKVAVPIKDLWKAISELRHIAPKVLPNIVEKCELLEGDGGQGSILLFEFHPDVPKVKYQREKIVELDESQHQICVKLLEGGHLDYGFMSYMTRYKLTEVGETETLIDVKVLYDTKPDHTHMPGEEYPDRTLSGLGIKVLDPVQPNSDYIFLKL